MIDGFGITETISLRIKGDVRNVAKIQQRVNTSTGVGQGPKHELYLKSYVSPSSFSTRYPVCELLSIAPMGITSTS